MEASESGRSFRFTWSVENCSFLWHREHQFLKWTFNMKRNFITSSWSLLLYPSTPKNCVSCFLRKESSEPLNFPIDYELSFLHEDGSHLHSIKVSSADFNSKSRSALLWLHRDDMLYKRASLPQDTLRICCKIWTANTPIVDMVRYFAETKIKVERCTLTWDIVSLSGFKKSDKRDKFVIDPLLGKRCITVSLFLDQLSNFIVEIFVLIPKLMEFIKCEIFLIDVSGKKLKCGRFEVLTIGKTTDPDWKFPLSLTRRILNENRDHYLQNDTLTLQFELAIGSGIEAEPVQKLEPINGNNPNGHFEVETSEMYNSRIHSESLPDLRNCALSVSSNSANSDCVSDDLEESNLSSLKSNANSNLENVRKNNTNCLFSHLHDSQSSSKEEHNNYSLYWKNDLLSFYQKGIFCDAELVVASDNFPVHSLILSVRSAVFAHLFTRAKKQGKKMCVNIDNLDAATVGKMITFLYTDTIEDLDCECAKGLYLASKKYEILPLNDLSTSFIKKNLSSDICCEILLLADEYKDNCLKRTVQDFIAKHDDEVLNSNQWRALEESHPHLTIEIFRFIFQKLRNK